MAFNERCREGQVQVKKADILIACHFQIGACHFCLKMTHFFLFGVTSVSFF